MNGKFSIFGLNSGDRRVERAETPLTLAEAVQDSLSKINAALSAAEAALSSQVAPKSLTNGPGPEKYFQPNWRDVDAANLSVAASPAAEDISPSLPLGTEPGKSIENPSVDTDAKAERIAAAQANLVDSLLEEKV